MFWLAACATGDFEADVVSSDLVPSAFRVAWDGPAGEATLSAAEGLLGDWQVVRVGAVEEGETIWPLGLWPAGTTVRYRIEVDTGARVLQSLAGSVAIPALPDTFGRPRLTRVDRPASEAATGFVVTQRYAVKPNPSLARALVLNGDGEPVWWAEPDPAGHRVIRARPSRDGRSILVLQDHDDPDLRRIDRIALDGGDSLRTVAPGASHDFWENEDGTFTYVAHDIRFDVHLVDDYPTAADLLRTVPEGAEDLDEAIDGFSFFDDYPIAPWYPCAHAVLDFFVPGANEWTHVNSIARAPTDDGYWLSVRHLDAIVHVNDDGTFGWQAGGRDATLTALGGASFEHGHMSHAFDGDRILMFDNGDHSPAPVLSRVVELQLDPASGVWQEVWSLPEPHDGFTSFLGDARRLPNGNTLVAWTDDGILGEYTPEGDEVWRMESDERYGRATWVSALSP